MILAILYLYWSAQGVLPFDPWWVIGFALLDALLIGSIGSVLTGREFSLFDADLTVRGDE